MVIFSFDGGGSVGDFFFFFDKRQKGWSPPSMQLSICACGEEYSSAIKSKFLQTYSCTHTRCTRGDFLFYITCKHTCSDKRKKILFNIVWIIQISQFCCLPAFRRRQNAVRDGRLKCIFSREQIISIILLKKI